MNNMNKCSRTHYQTFTNMIKRMRHLFVFVYLTNRTKFLVHVRSLTKRMKVNELPEEWFTYCSLNVRFVYNPNTITSLNLSFVKIRLN
ncbi:hypothetical protein Hanom_Chr11g01012711 [Helianthus anomalus]